MNEAVFYFFYNLAHRNPVLDSAILFVADNFSYVVIMAAGIFLLFHHEVFKAESPVQILKQKYKEIALVFFSGALAWFFAHAFKIFLKMPRPVDSLADITALFEKTGYGFPSGHAAFFAALATSIYFSHKKAGYVFALAALAIGLARVATGVHFPLDILGGFALGFSVAYLVKRI